LILSSWALVFLFIDAMRHRRVGRFVAGHFTVLKRVNRQALKLKYYPKGGDFSYQPAGLGLDGLYFRDYLCPATK
jgi:hypothetical protein